MKIRARQMMFRTDYIFVEIEDNNMVTTLGPFDVIEVQEYKDMLSDFITDLENFIYENKER